MFNIPTILTTDELLDKIFHKASKKTENLAIRNKLIRKKKTVISKINAVSDSLDSTFSKYITTFPSFDQLHKFDFELIHIILSVDKIRKSLGALDWARKTVRSLKSQIEQQMKQIRDPKDIQKLEQYRETFYGRVTSILKQISPDLEFLNHARNRMKQLPKIDPEITTIVVAGFPNVGKSMLVKNISSAKPKIAVYPFTTTQINLGHLIMDRDKIQVIDTPGLLDRSPEKRNKIERQAIMALQYLADLIIFMLDPSEHCGYTMDEQIKLLDEVHILFKGIKIIDVENKMDIIQTNSKRLKISASESTGLDKLLEIIQRSLPQKSNLQESNIDRHLPD